MDAQPQRYVVRSGTTDRHFGGSEHKVESIKLHSGPGQYDYDIAVLRVTPPFNFSRRVQPAALPGLAGGKPFPSMRHLTVTGYGAIGEVRYRARLAPHLR